MEKRNKENWKYKKIGFWNIAGLDRQDENFWNYIKGYDYIGMSKTWLTERRWGEIEGKLPETHIWCSKHAKKVKERGRAKGGLLIDMRKEWGEEEMECIETGIDGYVIRESKGQRER